MYKLYRPIDSMFVHILSRLSCSLRMRTQKGPPDFDFGPSGRPDALEQVRQEEIDGLHERKGQTKTTSKESLETSSKSLSAYDT